MTSLVVDTDARMLTVDGERIPCAIGRSGACAAGEKREGDGMTPRGLWPIRGLLLRPDRIARPGTSLPWRWLRRIDGWSDDPADPAYNRPVLHPNGFSAERLWRDDGLYDVVIVLGHNDAPPMPGAGSAIFLHCWNDGAPTEGCVAIERNRLVGLIETLQPGDVLDVR